MLKQQGDNYLKDSDLYSPWEWEPEYSHKEQWAYNHDEVYNWAGGNDTAGMAMVF